MLFQLERSQAMRNSIDPPPCSVEVISPWSKIASMQGGSCGWVMPCTTHPCMVHAMPAACHASPLCHPWCLPCMAMPCMARMAYMIAFMHGHVRHAMSIHDTSCALHAMHRHCVMHGASHCMAMSRMACPCMAYVMRVACLALPLCQT